MEQKDSTSQHYTDTERITLAQLVGEKKHIIENKKTDSATTKEKNEAWLQIADAYNTLGFTPRNSKQLKKCWDNMKQRKRKLSTEMRHERLLTGGGPPIKKPTDTVIDFVDIVAPHADFQLECAWDSTSVFETQNEKANTEPNTSNDSDKENNIYEHNNMLGETSASQRQSTSTALSTPTTSSEKARKLKKNCGRCICEEETHLRIQKLRESIEQQKKLHEKRMKVAEEEIKLAILKTLIVERDCQN